LKEDFKPLQTDYFSGRWFNTETDIDVLLSRRENLPRLRMLSNFLVRNNFLASGAQFATVNHVCADKVVVKPMYRKRVHRGLLDRLTSDLSQIDKSRSESIPEIIRQITGMSFEKGDCLVNIALDKNRKGTKTYCEVIDGSRIKTPPKHRKDPTVVEGIKKIGGVPVGAYVRKLQEVIKTYSVRPERDEDFVYVPFFRDIEVDGEIVNRRVAILVKGGNFSPSDQTRGIPATIASSGLYRYYEDYLNTTLIGKRVSNAITGFITTTNSGQTADNLQGLGKSNQLETRGMLNPGMIASLKPGESITPFVPRAQSEGDDMFSKRILRLSSVPNQLPYEILHQDLSDINYSSWKGGQMQMNRSLVGWDIQAIKAFRLVVQSLLLEYYMTGLTNLKPDDITLILDIPRPTILDPEKDARGEKTELTNGSASIHDLHDRRGTDYDATLSEQTQEKLDQTEQEAIILRKKKELSEKYGIVFPENTKQDKTASVRKGEQVDDNGEIDEETKKERRRDDGNW